jgi:broad specificity phosphatase PhoE
VSTPGDSAHPNAVPRPATKIVFVSHAPTTATRSSSFPDDEPLEREDSVAPVDLGRWGHVLCGPELRCRQTAAGLGWEAVVEPALSDLDFGAWRGLPLHEVPDTEAGSWLNDPAATPHGGESVQGLLTRVGEWLDGIRNTGERIVAVTHPAVVRAAVIHVLMAPAWSFWRIDVPPLSQTRLTSSGGSWTLRETGHPVIN